MPIEFTPLESTAIDDAAAAIYRMQVQAMDTGMGSTAGIDTLVAHVLVMAVGEDDGGGLFEIVLPDSRRIPAFAPAVAAQSRVKPR